MPMSAQRGNLLKIIEPRGCPGTFYFAAKEEKGGDP